MGAGQISTSDDVLSYISAEYNRLEELREGLGDRFFESVESIYRRTKENPMQFPSITPMYRRALITLTKKLQYALYFRLSGSEPEIFIDLILPTSSDPGIHP